MPSVCLYFKIHQPRRIKDYTIFDIGKDDYYFDDQRNKFYLDRIVNKCYRPTLKIIKELIEKTKGKFKVNFGISGVLIEQLQKWHPEIIEILKELSKTKSVEFTGENYYHSLSCLFDLKEFKHQVNKHKILIKKLFGQEPICFANTELIYFDNLEPIISQLGFKAVITEGVERILQWRSANFLYQSLNKKLKILLRNYQLSDDISFRFSAQWWEEWPLTAEKFAYWLSQFNGNGEVINLFMDFETFGEHQWEETGIFEFLKALPFEIFKQKDLEFSTISEVISKYPARGIFSTQSPITWADTERDLTAWLGNQLQQRAIQELYKLKPLIKNQNLLEVWRNLQTADHFYYMCTKWFADGDVHKYFNPYQSPYEAFLNFMNVIEDFKIRLAQKF